MKRMILKMFRYIWILLSKKFMPTAPLQIFENQIKNFISNEMIHKKLINEITYTSLSNQVNHQKIDFIISCIKKHKIEILIEYDINTCSIIFKKSYFTINDYIDEIVLIEYANDLIRKIKPNFETYLQSSQNLPIL